ncbi:uncharacterized protein FIBRA_07393 [Fibroporia radiculosa]|uniref:Uncharacterized protein n=1 Tax=Fibroporia radiculosa TaxID=599839 RepID=J4H4L2_9APHY|nr:uncharacterized protein FIBRA_07393 [Fibroporia radiculosa]CCM05184.1 predicted protein [Fibroporia radiculosa]
MAPPPIQLFLTTIISSPTVRQRQEYILRVLQVKKVSFISYDLASDEDAKKLWRRKAPRGYEEAVEFGELEQFLRLNEDYKPFEDDQPALPAKPVGVAGAYTPAQMHPHHQATSSPSASPLKSKGRVVSGAKRSETDIDAGEELGDSRLQGVSVTEDELLALVEELGLGGDDANDLVKGLTGDSPPSKGEGAQSEKLEMELKA